MKLSALRKENETIRGSAWKRRSWTDTISSCSGAPVALAQVNSLPTFTAVSTVQL
ncbi:hypothetical protein ACLB1Q_34215 [Escherichia coli]